MLGRRRATDCKSPVRSDHRWVTLTPDFRSSLGCSRPKDAQRSHSLGKRPKCTQAAKSRGNGSRGTGWNECRKFATRQEDHLVGQAAPILDPFANGRRVGIHHKFRGIGARDNSAGLGPPEGSMKPEHGLRGDADMVTWNDPDHHGAGREALAVDDYALTGVPGFLKALSVFEDCSAIISGDPQGRVGRVRNAERRAGGRYDGNQKAI